MNILELDSFNLADAVKFNDQLNPRIWDKNKMRPEVRAKLLEIAKDFREFLGVDNLNVKDITVSGSNASYHYTPHSDIDLHLVVDVPQLNNDAIFRELFDAKKYQYNDLHNIKIGGYDVELYVEDAGKPPVSQGIFSVLNNDWINIPKKRRATVDDTSVKSKYEDIKHRIESAVEDQDFDRIDTLARKIKAYRQAGLAKHGEFGPENIAYKMLRNQGYIGKLYDAKNAARDAELSLNERKKKKKRVKYGFSGAWIPAFDFSSGEGGDGGGMAEDVTLTPDGVSASTKMFLSEKDEPSREEIISDFMNFVVQELDLQNAPTLKIKKDPQWSVIHKTFGRYRDDLEQIELAVGDRHIMDVLRTLAHELQHRKQDEQQGMPPDAGKTGSRFENEANAMAGVLMRKYAELHPEYFDDAPVNESASGYIPTKKQANDPRYKMALTVDIKPGQVGREANKMALKTDAQGKPGLLIKSANMLGENAKLDKPELTVTQLAKKHKVSIDLIKQQLAKGIKVEKEHTTDTAIAKEIALNHLAEFPDYYDRLEKVETNESIFQELSREFELLESEIIGEIKMSPSSLRQEAAKTGALAGMEFEMIVPEVGTVDDREPQFEPDYDADRRATSFDQVEEFFNDGDYNSSRDVASLIDKLSDQYQEWQYEQIDDAWNQEGQEYLRNYVDNNNDFDRDNALDQARDEIIDANPNLPTESEEFQQLVNARISELEEQFVEEIYDNGQRGRSNRIYDSAFEAFADEQREAYGEKEFLRENYPYMNDISNNFDITWPYYYDANALDDSESEINAEHIADDFSEAIGRPVNYSSEYHRGKREPGKYVVEPDGSLEPDDYNDAGLEFVSPPLPIDELLNDLKKVREWARRIGAYTNKSTGLHINISVPNYSLEKLDYIKLALLMGDDYVLNLFGRAGNTYTKSATEKIKNILRNRPELASQLLDQMKTHMADLATKAIHSGTTDKYTSINTKDGYIEFRSPGGDWLDENFDKIENTLLRFTVAMNAALDPDAYREEYLKKLYKLLDPVIKQEKGDDTVKYFAEYVAGKIPKAALRSFVKQAQLQRKISKNKEITGDTLYWWNVQWDDNRRMEVVAGSAEVARQVAAEEWGVPESQLAGAKVTPLRPYRAPESTPRSGPTLNGRPSNSDGNYVIVKNNGGGEPPYYRFMAANNEDADTVLLQWSRENPGEWKVRYDPGQQLGQPPVPGSTMDLQRRRATAASTTTPPANQLWSLRLADGQEVHRFWNRNDRDEAGRYAANWLRNNGMGVSGEGFSIEPVTNDTQQQSSGPDPGSLIDQGLAAGDAFTGNWLIQDPNGRTIHRFGGIGNSQGDANNFAIRWLQQNPQHLQSGVTVVPEMSR